MNIILISPLRNILKNNLTGLFLLLFLYEKYKNTQITVCPGSSDPPEKIFNIFASENEVYTIY